MTPQAAMLRLLTIAVVGGATLVGCSSVGNVYVTPDFDKAHRTRTYRLNIVARGLPADSPEARLWTLVAQRWVNHHRDFIAKRVSTAKAPVAKGCVEDTEAVLWLDVAMRREGGDVAAKATAVLSTCPAGKRVWSADASGSWAVADEQLKATTARYVRELGKTVEPYVPATFRLLRELLDTLPRPKLVRDDDVMEKIDYAD